VQTIYKYFSQMGHLKNFVEQGEVYLNSLSYFLACEDISRRDETENLNVYRPTNGLQINNLTIGKTFSIPAQLNSQIKGANRIFIFCTSSELSPYLFKKFGAYGCVEISSVDIFRNRLRSKFEEFFGATHESGAFLADHVSYYDIAAEPGVRHACPDQIVMTKPQNFDDEKEYRFALTSDASLFKVHEVQYTISSGVQSQLIDHRSVVLKLGSLLDICKIVSP